MIIPIKYKLFLSSPEMRIVLFIFILSLLTGCSATSLTTNQDTFLKLQVPVVFISPQKTILPKEHFPTDIAIIMPTIPGEIFGNPSDELIFSGIVPEDYILDIDTPTQVHKSAKSLSREWLSMGLSTTPEQTRISRIGTFPLDPYTGRPIGGGGFINPLNKNHLILMYFDQACEIKGKFKMQSEWYDHDIVIPSEGFHFIEVNKISHNQFKLEKYSKTGKVNFTIHIKNIIDA